MLFHADCGKDFPDDTDTVRLWWLISTEEERAAFRHQVEELQGQVLTDDGFNFVFEVSVFDAHALGYDNVALVDSALIPE